MQKLQRIDGVQLVGVVDRAIECARGRAEEFALSQYAGSLDTLRGEFDVVSIAVPIPELADVALCAVENAHVLIEKPGALGTQSLEKLQAAVSRAGVKVAVGFLERFNQAIPSGRSVRRMVACRSAPRTGRDISLAYDLAVHDLDLAFRALGDVALRPSFVREGSDSFSLRLLGDQGREARVRVRTNASRKRRRIWMDGERLDLLSSQFDALGAQFDTFIQWVKGTGAWAFGRS